MQNAALEEQILDRVTQLKLAQAPVLPSQWYDPKALRNLYRTELAPNVTRVFSSDMAKQFQHYCPVLEATYSDYKNKWLELPDLGQALIGIRFRGLDLARPFVEVVVSEHLIRQEFTVSALVEAVSQAYRVFAPKHLRLFVPGDWPLDITRWPGAFWEKRYLAAPLERMRAAEPPVALPRVQLHKPSDMSFYRAYTELYERRFEAQPELREYTRVETAEDFEEYLAGGTIFEVLVDGAWAGVVVVTRAEEQGLRGFLVVENLLDPQLRGQGLGVTVQRRLANTLAGEAGDVLFGTIDARNVAAIKTAQRSGRSDVGGFLWLPL